MSQHSHCNHCGQRYHPEALWPKQLALPGGYIDWRAAAVGARAPGPPGDGWLPLVSARGGVLLAVRESPVRQVWVGLVSDAFAHAGFCHPLDTHFRLARR